MVNLILEGVDNLGKTTIINHLVQKYNSTKDIVLMHATGPLDKTLTKGPAFKFQTNVFKGIKRRLEVLNGIDNPVSEIQKEILVIQDRSEIGEYVYGPKYRNENLRDIVNYLGSYKNRDNQYEYDRHYSTLVILLTADPEFAARNDDNLSFYSDKQDKVAEIKNEDDAFKGCMWYLSPVNYLEIKVDNDMKFRPIDEIVKEITDKLDTLFEK